MDQTTTSAEKSPRPIGVLIWLERAAVLIVWLLLVMNFFYPWENFISPITGGGPSNQEFGTSHAILMVLYVLIGTLVLTRPISVLKTLGRAWPILLLTLLVLLSMIWAIDPGNTLNRAVRFISIIVFACYIAHRYPLAEFAKVFTWGFAITVAGSLAVMAVSPALGHSNMGGGYENAWRGGFTQKNWLGAAMSLGIFVSGFSYSIRANSRLLAGFTFIGCVFLLIMSRSASGAASTVAAILVMGLGTVIQNDRTRIFRGLAFIALAVGMVALILSPIILANVDIGSLPQIIGRSDTLTGRTQIWHSVLEAISARPILGYGYAFWDQISASRSNIWLEVGWQAPHAHNTWLDALLQLGWVGLAVTATAWLLPLCRSAWLIVVRQGHGALFLFAILFSSLLRSTVETVMFMPALQALFWLVTCYVYSTRLRQERADAVEAVRMQWPTPLHAYTAPQEQSV